MPMIILSEVMLWKEWFKSFRLAAFTRGPAGAERSHWWLWARARIAPPTSRSSMSRNPAFGAYPQWNPEPWPATKTNGDLAVTLGDFQTGVTVPWDRFHHQTQLAFKLTRNGQPADHWRVASLTISDATGNRFGPLDISVFPLFDGPPTLRPTGRFTLWPGENAWNVEVECVRTAGFTPDELWETPAILLPAPGDTRS